MLRLIYPLYLVLILLHQPFSGEAQSTPPKSRPKLGLVLSGGGAKGMAHIGVLKVLEEVGIVPDYITGTSMGSLVGALYAIGYTADEMEEVLTTVSWDDLLSDKVSLREITIEEKPYYGRYLAELPMDGIKIGLPRGALDGQMISELFSRLTLSVHDQNDFSKFPIPYAALAVDLPTGREVILNQGSLPVAMRASMAIPSIFTPIIIDSLLLVDGGLIRNFPVQEVRDMGADVVIGINVGGGFNDQEDIKTLTDVLINASFLYSNTNTLEDKKYVDFLIEPDLLNYSTSDFVSADSIIQLGYRSALNYKTDLQQLADSVYGAQWRPSPPENLVARDSFLIQRVVVEGNEEIPDSFIQGKLNVVTGEYIDIDQIEYNVELVYGTRYFNKISYEIHSTPQGDELLVYVEEAPNAFLRPALHFDTQNGAGFLLSYVHRNLLLPGSRLLLEADFAENPQGYLSYFKYLGREQQFAAILGADYLLNDVPAGFGEASDRASTVFRSSWLNPYLRIQSSMFRHWTVGLNASWETASLKPSVTSDLVVDEGIVLSLDRVRRFPYNSYQLGAYAQLNTLDDPVFPNRGWKVNMRFEQVLGVNLGITYVDTPTPIEELFIELFKVFEDTRRGNLEISQYTPLNPRINLQSDLIVTFTEKDLLSPYDVFNMGGFAPIQPRSYAFWGNNPYEVEVRNAILWREQIRYEIIPDLYADGVINFLVEDWRDFDNRPLTDQTLLGYGIGLRYRSVLGPIQLALAHQHNTRQWHGFFSLGFNIR